MTIVFNGTCVGPPGDATSSSSSNVNFQSHNSEQMKISGKDLTRIPEQIINSEILRILDLSDNAFGRGEIDDLCRSFCGLTRLTHLNLSANELKSWPTFLNGLSSLEVLSISGNELDSLPEDFRSFPRLSKLNLDYNHLKNLNAHWNVLNNLKSLSVSNNRLEEIPANLWNLPLLETLNLRKNRLSAIGIVSPASSQLSELNLSHNKLAGSLDFSLLTNLKTLDVSHNELKQIEVANLEKLQDITCSNNGLRSIHLMGTKLRTLKADDNDLETVTCEYTPVSLEILDLSYNNLTQLPNWVTQAKDLKQLYADHNLITEVKEGLFTAGMIALETVRLNHNLIEALPNLSSKCFIKFLCLQYNRIKNLPENFFTVLSRLDTLNLSYNLLEFFPPVSKCLQLKVIFLSGNNLNDVTCLESLFRHPTIRKLYLANNGIKTIPENYLNNCPSLEELSLSCNSLSKFSSHISKAKNLRKLYLQSNNLNVLPSLTQLPNLQVLDVACNNLNRIDLSTLIPKNLVYLDLSGNYDLFIDPSEFQHLCCQRSVAVVDVNSAGRIARTLDSMQSNPEEKIPWRLGFTETEEGNTRLYGELQNESQYGYKEAFLTLMEAESNELVSQLRQALPSFLKVERECEETSSQYLRNVLLSSMRFLRAKGPADQFGITICHFTSTTNGAGATLQLATVGRPSSCILGRSGTVIILAHREDTLPMSVGEWNCALQASEVCSTNQFGSSSKCISPKGSWSSIPDPEVRELVLSPQDKFLVFASYDFARCLAAEDVCRLVQSSENPVAASKALAEQYASATNGRRECVAVVSLQNSGLIKPSDQEDVEKYRCWEFMLEQNHKLLFTKELETIHKTIVLGDRKPNVVIGNGYSGDPNAWYSVAFSKYKCPLPSHRGRYYCYGNKTE